MWVMMEIWKPVIGYEELYEVSNLGKIKSLERTVNRRSYIPRHPEFGAVALGKRFGVHRKTISRITTEQCWKGGDVNHVKG